MTSDSRDYPRPWSLRTVVSRDYPRVWRLRSLVSRDYPCALVGTLDYVPLHERDGARNHLEQRQSGLAQRELQLAQQRVQSLHGLDRVADVDVRRQRDLVERLARRPSVGEVD